MIKVKVKHLETEREYGMQGSKEEAEAYCKRMESKFGKDKLKITKSDSDKNKTLHNELAKQSRREAYASIDCELMQALAEDAEGNPLKLKEYLVKREKIKQKHFYKV